MSLFQFAIKHVVTLQLPMANIPMQQNILLLSMLKSAETKQNPFPKFLKHLKQTKRFGSFQEEEEKWCIQVFLEFQMKRPVKTFQVGGISLPQAEDNCNFSNVHVTQFYDFKVRAFIIHFSSNFFLFLSFLFFQTCWSIIWIETKT